MNLYHDMICYKRVNAPLRPCPSWLHLLTWLGAVAVTAAAWVGLAMLIMTF